MKVEDIVQGKGHKVITISPDTSVVGAAEILHGKRIGILVVCNEALRVQGVFSERDVVRAVAETPDRLATLKVKDFLTRDVVTCTRKDKLQDVMRTMTERRFRHMPVVEDGELKGLISIGDVLKHLLKGAKSDQRALGKLHDLGFF